MNEKLSKLLVEYTTTLAHSIEDLSGSDSKSRIGLETRKKMAVEYLPVLKQKIKQAYTSSIIKIFLTGNDISKISKFLNELSKTEQVPSISADRLYYKLAASIEPTLDANHIFSTGQAVRLVEELYDVCKELDVREMPLPKVDTLHYNSVITSIRVMVNIIKNAITITSGHDLNKIFIEQEVFQTFLSTFGDLKFRFIPVIIFDVSNKEATELNTQLFPNAMGSMIIDVDLILDDENLVTNITTQFSENLKQIFNK